MKKTTLAFFLEMDVANDSVDAANKELSSHSFNGQNINAICINIKDDEDHHGILNVEVDLELEKNTELYDKVCESIKDCLSKVEEIYVQEWDMVSDHRKLPRGIN